MGFDRTSFAVAVALSIDVGVSLRLQEAWANAAPTPDESEKDAGRALAIALSTLPVAEAAAQVDGLTLMGLELGLEGAPWLNPQDARAHPLFGEWAATTFADALGDCIRGGRLCVNLAPSAPIFSAYELIEEEGRIKNATADLLFDTRNGQIRARLRYGERGAGIFGRASVCSGDAVYRVGAALQGTVPLRSDEGDEDDPPAPTAHPVVH